MTALNMKGKTLLQDIYKAPTLWLNIDKQNAYMEIKTVSSLTYMLTGNVHMNTELDNVIQHQQTVQRSNLHSKGFTQ